jgi:hypothetical protein
MNGESIESKRQHTVDAASFCLPSAGLPPAENESFYRIQKYAGHAFAGVYIQSFCTRRPPGFIKWLARKDSVHSNDRCWWRRRRTMMCDTATTLDQLPPDLLTNIISFVGPYQYRWVAGVHRRWRTAYQSVFAEQKTYHDASTLALAQLCFQDNVRRCKEQRWLCAMAAQQGNLVVLQFLHQSGCAWDTFTCHRAARSGQFCDSAVGALARLSLGLSHVRQCGRLRQSGHAHLGQNERMSVRRMDDAIRGRTGAFSGAALGPAEWLPLWHFGLCGRGGEWKFKDSDGRA